MTFSVSYIICLTFLMLHRFLGLIPDPFNHHFNHDIMQTKKGVTFL